MRTCEQPGEPLSLQGPCLARPPPTLQPGPSAAPCAVKPHPSLSGRTWRQIFGGGGVQLVSIFVLWSLFLLFKEWGGEGWPGHFSLRFFSFVSFGLYLHHGCGRGTGPSKPTLA